MVKELTVKEVEVVKPEYRYEVKDNGETKTFPTYNDALRYANERNRALKAESIKAELAKTYPGGCLGKITVFTYDTRYDFPERDTDEYWLYGEGVSPHKYIDVVDTDYQRKSFRLQQYENGISRWWVRNDEDDKLAAMYAAWELLQHYAVDVHGADLFSLILEMYNRVSAVKKLINIVEDAERSDV